MQITLHYSTKIGTIKQVFNKTFPYLKIEFIKKFYAEDENNSWSRIVLHNMFVGEINNAMQEGSINISADRDVLSLQQMFQESFGLQVHVFRKQKKKWVATNLIESLTLAQQNELGKASCNQSLSHYFSDTGVLQSQALTTPPFYKSTAYKRDIIPLQK